MRRVATTGPMIPRILRVAREHVDLSIAVKAERRIETTHAKTKLQVVRVDF